MVDHWRVHLPANMLLLVSAFGLVGGLALPDSNSYATNITIYHVNERQFGPIPINMDTGDALGDLFFDMLEVIGTPMKCTPGTPPPPPFVPDPCKNQEAVGGHLRVNKLTLEVDSRFSGYATCNVGVNGTDPFGQPCKDDTYCCLCTSTSMPPHPVACEATLGYENVYEQFGHFIKVGCDKSDSTIDCYTHNVYGKLSPAAPGAWYSSLQKGYCGDHPLGYGNCTWRVVSVDKIVKRECHTQVFGSAVAATAPECFTHCGNQSTNVSSPCWVDCFYKAALGPDAGKPGGAIAGMSTAALVEAWVKPFVSEVEGGCPPQ